jgi:hypothetical protein
VFLDGCRVVDVQVLERVADEVGQFQRANRQVVDIEYAAGEVRDGEWPVGEVRDGKNSLGSGQAVSGFEVVVRTTRFG